MQKKCYFWVATATPNQKKPLSTRRSNLDCVLWCFFCLGVAGTHSHYHYVVVTLAPSPMGGDSYGGMKSMGEIMCEPYMNHV